MCYQLFEIIDGEKERLRSRTLSASISYEFRIRRSYYSPVFINDYFSNNGLNGVRKHVISLVNFVLEQRT